VGKEGGVWGVEVGKRGCPLSYLVLSIGKFKVYGNTNFYILKGSLGIMGR